MHVHQGHPQHQIFSPKLLSLCLCLGVNRPSQHRALMENDERCLAKSALILINGGNSSADSQSTFSARLRLTTPLLALCEEHGDVGQQTQHDSDGEMKWESTDHQSAKSCLFQRVFQAEIEGEPHLKAGPHLGRKKVKKTMTKMIQLFDQVVFFLLFLQTVLIGSDSFTMERFDV